MKKKTFSFFVSLFLFIILIFMIADGFIGDFFKFCTWLVTLNMTQSSVSTAGEIFVKIAAWIISYISVGLLFNTIGLFNKKIMRFAYFVISTLVSFALCYVVMLLEKYLLYIAIIFSILLAVAMLLIITLHIKEKRRNTSKDKKDESETLT